MNLKVSEAGIVILASIPITTLLLNLLGPNLYVEWVWSGLMPESTLILITNVPFCALAIVGLMLYIAGRIDLWKHAYKHQIKTISVLLVTLGLFLIVWGFLASWGTYGIVVYLTHKGPERTFNQLLVKYSPPLLLGVLLSISGILLLVDTLKASLQSSSQDPDKTRNQTPRRYQMGTVVLPALPLNNPVQRGYYYVDPIYVVSA